MKRTFAKTDELIDALDGAGAKCISKSNWRHGHIDTIVFELEGTHWRTDIRVHHEEGWDLDDEIEAVEVHEVEKTVKVWEPKP